MKVAIIGPQNTGKSTFLADLLVEFPDFTTPKETYRDVVKTRGLVINRETHEESQRVIRDFLYQQLQENVQSKIFFDRSVIDNFIYSSYAHEKGRVSDAFLSETKTMMMDSFAYLDRLFFIPTAVSVSLTDDQLRDTDPLFIDQVNHLFIETLHDVARITTIPIHVISGDRSMRVKRAGQILADGTK